MMKVLITGCAGFIGSTLTEELLKRGYEVIGIDCYTDNYAHWIKEANIRSLLTHPRFRFIPSRLESIHLSSILQDIQYVFHQAALPGVRSSWGKNFSHYVEHNIHGTQALLEAVKEHPIKKMIYASSSSIYGSMDGPTSETRIPAPFSPYGVSKLAGEHLCQLYYHNHGVPVVSLRYFTVYGPRQRPDMAFSRFIYQMLKGEPIHVYGDGTQTRDFTYIQDAITANLLAAEKGKPGEIYNIGGNSKIELNQVIQLLETIMDRKAKIIYEPASPGDPKHTWADISKAQSELGYEPSYPIKKGLEKQVSYMINWMGGDHP